MATLHPIAAARELALRAHGDQTYGDAPYAAHLDEVAALVQPFGERHQIVAYLHDALEDTELTFDTIRERFGPLIADCVALVSDGPGASRDARKQATHAGLAAIGAEDERAIALVVKAADRLANVERCVLAEDRGRLRKYRREHRAFRAAAYRPGLADELWRQLDALIAPG